MIASVSWFKHVHKLLVLWTGHTYPTDSILISEPSPVKFATTTKTTAMMIMLMMMMMMKIIIIIIIIIIRRLEPFQNHSFPHQHNQKSKKLRNYKKSHIGHCTHITESANAKVPNLFHGPNNITWNTNCKYRQLQHYIPYKRALFQVYTCVQKKTELFK